ncbi:MAG: D-alanyl-D-alanine carboxypeptidase family protein [Chthoniobacterales bacterium]
MILLDRRGVFLNRLLVAFFFLSGVLAVFAEVVTVPETAPYRPSAAPEVYAKAFVLFDAVTGKVLLEKNSREKLPVASTQKLLTALLIAEAGNLDRNVKIQAVDTKPEPSKLYIKAGEIYSRRDLLQVLLVRSMNDVAAALARDHSGSVEEFALSMTARARRLKALSSNFKNPHGLPAEGQYSTARDMAAIARAVYFNPTLRKMIRTERFSITRPRDGKILTYRNTNKVLRRYLFCNGMKTGYTRASGNCLVASGAWNGRHMIAVILGSNSKHIWDDSTRLLAYGLRIPEADLPRFRKDTK